MTQRENRLVQVGSGLKKRANAVAGVSFRLIAGIVAPCLAMVLQKVAQLLPADHQERPQNRKAIDSRPRRHPRQPRRTRTAQEAKKNRLRLVVSVMGQDDPLKFLGRDHLPEKLNANGAKSRRGIGRQGLHLRLDLVAPRDGAWQRELCRQFDHERGVFGAGLAARLMVQMYDMQGQIGPIAQHQQQGHAIGAAADADGPGAGGDESRIRNHAAMLHEKAHGLRHGPAEAYRFRAEKPPPAVRKDQVVRRRRKRPSPARPTSDSAVGSGTDVPLTVILPKLQLPELLL